MTRQPARYWQKPARPEEMSVLEVAAALDISEQRVRQLESKALNKLRAAFEAKGFRPGDFID